MFCVELSGLCGDTCATLITRRATRRGEMNHEEEGGNGEGGGSGILHMTEVSLRMWRFQSVGTKISIQFWRELTILLTRGHDLPHWQAGPLWFTGRSSLIYRQILSDLHHQTHNTFPAVECTNCKCNNLLFLQAYSLEQAMATCTEGPSLYHSYFLLPQQQTTKTFFLHNA
jgi:hypothetical protein